MYRPAVMAQYQKSYVFDLETLRRFLCVVLYGIFITSATSNELIPQCIAILCSYFSSLAYI
jgi:hypothetical protein